MRDKVNLWRLYNTATAYGVLPCDLFPGLETDLARWHLNEAALMTGRAFENALNEGKDPFKGSAPVSSKQFASAPKHRVRKIRSLKEIGIK